MRAFEIKLSRIVRYKTKHACCSVAIDQWFRIVTGFVISIMRIKPVRFRDHTVGARELVDVIWSKKLEHSRAISVFGPSFLLLLGPPFTTYYNDLTFLKRKKSLSVPAAISAEKGGTQKVKQREYVTFHLARFQKGGVGPLPFMAEK